MDILIPTVYGDVHAIAVEIALVRMGHNVIRWFPALLPTTSSISFEAAQGAITSSLLSPANGSAARASETVDVLWNRRIGVPITKNLPLAAADKGPAAADLFRTVSSYLRFVSGRSLAINDFDAGRITENKIHQLSIASAVGICIPQTLLSNNPADIRGFLVNADESYVCKPLYPVIWQRRGGQAAISMTSRLRSDELPADEILQAGPMIIQREVPKKFELRVTCMGGFLHAVKLNSQASQDSALDWRAVSPSALSMEEVDLPDGTANQCLELMKRLGLHFGCLDLIVDTSGEYVFLEVNQMGQFLWIEQFQASIPMLDHFCSFLLAPAGRYDGTPCVETGGYHVLVPEIEAVLQQDLALHSKTVADLKDPSELMSNIVAEGP